MDGVLADTEDISIAVGIEYFGSIGRKAEKKDFEKHLGMGEYEFFMGTARELGVTISYKDASAFFFDHYEDLAKKKQIALPGGKALVESAKRAGIKVAICSSAPQWKVYKNLELMGLDPASMDYVVSGADVKRSKPYGDIYQLALIRFGLEGKDALVFEDTVGGIKAGKNAGCPVCGLTNTINSELAYSAGADIVISDLSAIPEFSTSEEFWSIYLDYSGISSDSVLYGSNYITPLKRQLPQVHLEKNAIEAAWKAWDNAYSPYSKFKVGASVVSAATGRIYSGCNVENSSYGATICAERNAITTAIAAEGKLGIDLLVVVSDDDPPAPPCAVCLQVIAEFAKPDTEVLLISLQGKKYRYKFSELLPKPFVFPTMRI